MPECEECGKHIPPRAAERIKRASGGRLLCRRCIFERAKSDRPVLVCKDCGEPIEPPILRRIARARRRRVRLPRLCRRCFLKRRDHIRDEPHQGDEKSLEVAEWECTHCGATLEPQEVQAIRANKVIQCEYCGKAVSRELFSGPADAS